ncbi:MAG TPA: hypothetical protein VM869_27855 [Enhygromyxa sp.]|nr:hypothetical protein [Enhygromyxa sp.]
MTDSTRIAVLRISIDLLREKHELEPTSDGWSAFEGADGERREVSPRGAVLLVRFSGGVGGLAASFGELWQHHAESRGVAVHEQAPEGDDYDSLVESASWEGSLFAQVASMMGGNKADEAEDEAAESDEPRGEGEGEGEADPFDDVADKLMAAVAKRSSRKVLAARLAAAKGEKDLGDVLDAMEAEEKEGDDALMEEVEGRFAFDVEHQDMAALLSRKLDTEEGEGEGEGETEQNEDPGDETQRAPSGNDND